MIGKRRFGEWTEIFDDGIVATPLLDHLLHKLRGERQLGGAA